MHFHAVVTARFQDLGVSTHVEGAPRGYTVALGINAGDVPTAAALASEDALGRHEAGGPRDVVYLELTAITKEDWVPDVRQLISDEDIDSPGIYYRSGVAFYENEDE